MRVCTLIIDVPRLVFAVDAYRTLSCFSQSSMLEKHMGESHLLVHHKSWYGRPKHPTTTPKRWGTRGAQEGHKRGTRGAREGHKNYARWPERIQSHNFDSKFQEFCFPGGSAPRPPCFLGGSAPQTPRWGLRPQTPVWGGGGWDWSGCGLCRC